jgi:hypothetical protein
MNHQVCRLLAALTLTCGAVFGLAACGGDGDNTNNSDPTTSASSSADASATPASADPSSFDDVQGKPLSYQRSYDKFTVLLKPFDTEWTAQFADKPADPGSKFLVVYSAARPKLTDRGVTKLQLDELWLRFEPVASGCEYPTRVGTVETCFVKNTTTLQPHDLNEPGWRDDGWYPLDYTGAELKPGEESVTALVFPVKDGTEAKNGFQLCGNPDGSYIGSDLADLPCVPVSVKS